jgi:DNA-binding NtrC family response regulator
MQLQLPPLRDRGDDVQELATLFMRRLSQQLAMPQVPIEAGIRAALARYRWPGNVRELRNLIERTLILGRFPEDFGDRLAPQSGAADESLEEIERRHILAMLQETAGDRNEAARRLGVSRKTIDRKCAAWNV